VVAEIERLRRQRWNGRQIAATGVSPATVSRVLRRLGLNKLSASSLPNRRSGDTAHDQPTPRARMGDRGLCE
jgi:hypothetical protein